MNELEVLVASVEQTDFSLIDHMNLQCNAIIANQAEKYDFSENDKAFGHIKMITTPTRGVGINRNIALMAATADFLLFSDDDMVYYDGVKEGVLAAFKQLPEADMIIFSVDIMKKNEIVEQRHLPIKKRHLWNSLQYGTYALAIRKDAVTRGNLSFHHSFGGGCIYGSGEDSLFICDCFKKKLKIYSHSFVLGYCIKDESTWFRGFNKKYFFDKGAFFNYAFQGITPFIILIFAIKMTLRKKTEISIFEMICQMKNGARASKKLITYEESVCDER